MQHLQNASPAIYRLPSLLEELSAGCDSEFDFAYEELDREFAEIRLQLSNR
jgi:hypothetical protein